MNIGNNSKIAAIKFLEEDSSKIASFKYLESKGKRTESIPLNKITELVDCDILLLKTGKSKYFINSIISQLINNNVGLILYGEKAVNEFKTLSKHLELIDYITDINNKSELYSRILNQLRMKELLRYVKNQKNTLESLRREKNELLGIAAHDLKNPIYSISLLAKVIKDDRALSLNEIREFSDDILETTNRMLELIKHILTINQFEDGKIKLLFEEFDIYELFRNSLSIHIDLALRKNIRIIFDSISDDNLVFADKTASLQIMDNLVSNAVKFSPPNSIVRMIIGSNSNYIIFKVIDSGPGLTSEDMKKIFQKFARLSAQPTAGENSSGLGLSIVKSMVEAMNGNIYVKSEPGNGAEFIVELPKSK